MSEKREVVQEVKIPFATVFLRSDGITEIVFIEEYLLEAKDIRSIQDAIKSIELEGPHYILVTPGPQGGITPEGRETPMFRSDVKAIAVITRLLHQRILGNLYFKFKKGKFENYKLFKEREDAENWLKNQRSIEVQS